MLSRFKIEKLRTMVPDGPARPHHEDALTCYRAGVYRLVPIAVWNAVFADLFQKIQHLAGVNNKFRKIADDAGFQKNEKNPFEQQFKQDLKAAKLISDEQLQFLDELRDWRNDFAHPTDRTITATKAGSFIEDGVSLFLSERSFNAHTIVHEITGKLHTPGFFGSANPSFQLSVVRDVIATVTPHAFHNLIRNVLEVLVSKDRVSSRNASAFLRCCVQLENSAITSVVLRHLFEPKLQIDDGIEDPYNRTIWEILTYAPQCVDLLPDAKQKQFDRKLASLCSKMKGTKDHRYSPSKLFGRLLKSHPTALQNILKQTCLRIIHEYPVSPNMILGLRKLPEHRSDIVASWRRAILSRDIHEAAAVRSFLDLNARTLALVLDGPVAYSLLLPLTDDRNEEPGEIIFDTLKSIVHPWLEADLETARAQARRVGLFDPADYLKVVGAIQAHRQKREVA